MSTNPKTTTTPPSLAPLRVQAPTIQTNSPVLLFYFVFSRPSHSSINNHFNKLNHLLTKPLHIEHRTYTYTHILQTSKHKVIHEFKA